MSLGYIFNKGLVFDYHDLVASISLIISQDGQVPTDNIMNSIAYISAIELFKVIPNLTGISIQDTQYHEEDIVQFNNYVEENIRDLVSKHNAEGSKSTEFISSTVEMVVNLVTQDFKSLLVDTYGKSNFDKLAAATLDGIKEIHISIKYHTSSCLFKFNISVK